jgi:predicted kinase
MGKLILTRGVPASGKSTWAKAWVAEDPLTRVRVNRDNLRWTLGVKGGVGDQWQEEEVTHWQNQMVTRYLSQGKDVVVDNTNLRARHVKELIRLGQKWGAEIEFKDFPVSIWEAQRWDELRAKKGERSVGPEVIAMFFQKFIGKDGISLPPIPEIANDYGPVFRPYVEQEGLPHAIIVDIDGTLAHMNGRDPYDGTLVHTDTFDSTIGMIATLWAEELDTAVIVLSGRDEKYREVTVNWLGDNNFDFDVLYMRPEGDTRNDAVVKDELFEKHIAGKYNVDFVLDDRNRVVEMWRAKGLRVLQVAEGDF